ncbi:MAG: C-GCAxxG-C-C family protein [Candidatus Pelethousia sp.]|nr:C-GCAxxG-C-C family protein [Candidatus Pelethousia sp.]
MMSTEEKIQRAYELGFKYEKEIKGCSQSTIQALMEVYGETDSDVYQSMAAFSAGGAVMGDGMCGGYAAGLLFFGLHTGRRLEDLGADPDEPRASSKNNDNFRLARQLHDRFIMEYGTVVCHQIHRNLYGRPYSITDPDEKRKFEEAGAHDWGCTSVCGNAAKWTAEIYEAYLAEKGGAAQ